MIRRRFYFSSTFFDSKEEKKHLRIFPPLLLETKRKFHNSPASIKIGRWYLLVLLISVVQTLLLLHDEVINAATSRMLRLVYRERDEWVELYITFYITLNRNERNFRGANRLPSSPLPLHITERRKIRIEFSTWRLIKPAKRKIEAVPNIIAATGAFKVNNELGGENFIRRPYHAGEKVFRRFR